MMLSDQQLQTMLQLQARMNSHVDENWLQASYPYLRAVVIEGAEAMEHHGWKWWKHQHLDLAQLQMELIDIWHFLLSDILLRCGGDLDEAVAEIRAAQSHESLQLDGHDYALSALSLLDKLQLLIATAAVGRNESGLFAAIVGDSGMGWQELFGQYVGKNVLNMFRQDHGYKQGSYHKHWQGREDNEHLVEILQQLDPAQADYQEQIYTALLLRYPAT